MHEGASEEGSVKVALLGGNVNLFALRAEHFNAALLQLVAETVRENSLLITKRARTNSVDALEKSVVKLRHPCRVRPDSLPSGVRM